MMDIYENDVLIKTLPSSGGIRVKRLLNGKYHHAILPAIEYVNGGGSWFYNGERHRNDGLPAVDLACGDKFWWMNGQRHRDGGLPAVELENGDKEWWVNGQRHRNGGLPAVDLVNGHKEWWVDGYRHRDGDLPAVKHVNGIKEWWINGRLDRRDDLFGVCFMRRENPPVRPVQQVARVVQQVRLEDLGPQQHVQPPRNPPSNNPIAIRQFVLERMNHERVEDCPICMEGMNANVVMLQKCNHLLHASCYQQHAKKRKFCPVCRME